MFRKYGFTFAVLAFTIVAIGMYAVTTGWKTSGSPEFRLVTVEGKAPSDKDFTVEANYKYTNSISSQVNIGEQGVSYEPTRFHFRWFGVDTVNDEFGNTKEKRRFMAGKKAYGRFVNEPSMLSYSNSEQVEGRWELEVATLNKETKKTTQFTLDLPKHERVNYWFTNVNRQIDDSNISVYMVRYEEPQSSKETNFGQIAKIIRLDINLDTQTITKETDLISELAGLDSNAAYRANFITFTDTIGLIALASKKQASNDETASSETTDYYAYDFRDYSLRKLAINDEQTGNSYQTTIVNDRVDSLSVNEGVVYYNAFKLYEDSQELPAPWKVDTHAWGANDAQVGTYNAELVRITYQNDNNSAPLRGVALVNAKTGEVIYRGEVQTDGSAEEQNKRISRLVLM
ncbi:hypothetical protein PCCS19_32110 [Paenibacillus sp. CCS19]|uniref:hypothetical protein n=1 Tax=Paenibacillus sp. CCS19 TaxID=3158387 RepID=UPI00255DA626|nr:hypothetical protein [Paenibacillus cellulosilyticus]GMK40156.1 hypothetical protein PCCS19_32110 [Paenibacillus cellulosilyticus]